MKFNIDKCYIMHVTHKRNTLLMTYNMNGRPIEVTASHTFLGIGINNKLSRAEHISNTVSKANKVLGLLRRNLHSCSPFVDETACNSLVRPKLEYCSVLFIWDPTTRSIKIGLNRFNVELHDLSVSHVCDMLRDLSWKMLEDRRTIYRLALLYKSVHNIVSINIDEHYTNHEKRNVAARKTSSISFAHPTARRNFCRYSFIPWTVAEWNPLPAIMREAPSIDTFKARLCSIKFSTHFTRKNGLITFADQHTCSCIRLSRMW